ncbi:MAG: DedA family protein [Prolixibacteraceae bacterium]|jgi:membrane protein DedA with SNARE-associated domain|nr:DedA family protein [Prolixibacteraceae bacterium]MDI9564409.1 DedA family protein [Bacteroidota bacterium]OQB79153.1 MAG: Inner membrane protein YqjA [Bacteroidetes bacterium ADurb.Bin123]HNU78370.1 DedA family protein [Prolixibacteraceae bacterium]HNZ69629.1 DedA family protein [Prolixibacteraceae bacterium]
MIQQFFSTIIDWYMAHINYWTITLLMAIESSFIPFPSEVVIPPAAWKAAEGDLNVFLVVFFGTVGALIGALFNYYFALYLGRAIVYRFAESKVGRLMLLSRQGVEKAEAYFVRHGKSSTLIGRLVPAVRQLISLPAGLARMKLKDFILFTVIGSATWNIILAAMGYFLYTQKEILHRYYTELSWAMVVLGVMFIIYLVFKFVRREE